MEAMKGFECVRTRSVIDILLGMRCYLTSGDPILPSRMIDHNSFYVYEYTRELGVLKPPITPPREHGGILVYLMIKKGIDTYHAIKILRRNLKPRRISFYGLKDARATTYQVVTVESPGNFLTYMLDKKLEAILIGTSTKHAMRGGLIGNCFKISLGYLLGGCVGGELYKLLERISELGFIPNYYSYQRFGVSRPITHIAGLAILSRQYERALYSIVSGKPSAGLPPHEIGSAIVEVCRDITTSSPRWMDIERRVCREYLESRTPLRAIKRIPSEYIDLYISAAGSFIFNLYLSHRWEENGLGLEPLDGEVVLKSNIYGSDVPGKRISSEDISSGSFREEYTTSLESLGLEPRIQALGAPFERPLVLPIKIDVVDASDCTIWFCLDSGGYATNLLREIFKGFAYRLFGLMVHQG